MNTIDSHKEHIKNIQIKSIQSTREILKMIDDSQNKGARSLEILDNQYEQLEKINDTHDTINENLNKSSSILGKIKYFFFPRKVTKIEKINKKKSDDSSKLDNTIDTDNLNKFNKFNINKSIKHKSNSIKSNEFIDETLEEQLDKNIDEINLGVANLKNIALDMNFALDRDKELLEQINSKSEIVTKNIKNVNKEITKLL